MPGPLRAVILVVGDELLAGRTRDGNGAWLAERLTALGLEVVGIRICGDAAEAVAEGVRSACAEAPRVVVTGGLGPTDDDGTRAGLALAADVPLVEDERALAWVKDAQEKRGFALDERRRREARLPRGGRPIPNPSGTAPGIALTLDGAELYALPGVPRECRAMFERAVLPLLGEREGRAPPASFAFRVAGVREPDAAERVAALALDEALDLAFYPHEGELEIRLTTRGVSATERAGAAAQQARLAFGDAAYDNQPIQVAVVRTLRCLGLGTTTAESLTGGLIARMLVEVEGASEVFCGGWITYSDAWKRDALGVESDLLDIHGAVSAEVASAMAEGARARARTAFAVAATGVAGPDDGRTPDGETLPAGTFFVAVRGPGRLSRVERHHVPLERLAVQRRAAVAAIDLLRRLVREFKERGGHD